MNGRSFAGLSEGKNTPGRVRKELEARGVDIRDLFSDIP
jgi:hypothetical protein